MKKEQEKKLRKFIREEIDRGEGMFTMEFLSQVEQAFISRSIDLGGAKKMLKTAVDGSGAKEVNKKKAHGMIDSAGSFKTLMVGAGNFSLSHHGPGYKAF